MHNNPLSDEERQELYFLREENAALKKELEEFRRGKRSNPPKQDPLEELKEYVKIAKPSNLASLGKASNPIQKEESSDDEEFEKDASEDTEFDEESADCGQLEKRLDSLRKKIRKHRMKTGGKCWFFGKDNVELDYGANWDNTNYWNMRISIGGKSSLADFAYKNKMSGCDDCKATTLKMNKAWESWKRQKGICE